MMSTVWPHDCITHKSWNMECYGMNCTPQLIMNKIAMEQINVLSTQMELTISSKSSLLLKADMMWCLLLGQHKHHFWLQGGKKMEV